MSVKEVIYEDFKDNKALLYEQMKHGYQCMGKINLTIAKEWVNADNETTKDYEIKLSECE